MRVIFSARVAWATSKDANVAENVQTTSIMARKSRVERDICCGGGDVVLGPTKSI